MRRNLTLLVLVALVGFGDRLMAQSTGTPVVMAPIHNYDDYTLGATVSDPGPGIAVEGWYGMPVGPGDILFRVGIWDNNSGTTTVLLGADSRTSLVRHSEKFPLDGALTVGAGGSFGSGASVFLIPVGFSLGRRVDIKDSNIVIQPYGVPILHIAFGDNISDNLLFSLGLGFEIQFSDSFALDVNGVIGDLDGISVGFAYLR